MFCKKCGHEIADDSLFCNNCGAKTTDEKIEEAKPLQTAPQVPPVPPKGSRPCPKCKSLNVQYQTVTESRKTGCFKVFLYIILAISVLGWLVLIPLLLRKKTKTVTYGVCQNCGHRWRT